MDSRVRGNDKKKEKEKTWIPACAGMTKKKKKKKHGQDAHATHGRDVQATEKHSPFVVLLFLFFNKIRFRVFSRIS